MGLGVCTAGRIFTFHTINSLQVLKFHSLQFLVHLAFCSASSSIFDSLLPLTMRHERARGKELREVINTLSPEADHAHQEAGRKGSLRVNTSKIHTSQEPLLHLALQETLMCQKLCVSSWNQLLSQARPPCCRGITNCRIYFMGT